MARERMVTRTVNVAECDVMTVNVNTAEVRTITVEIGGGISDSTILLKMVKKTHESASTKCVAITAIREREVLYGMPESEFIKLAKVLPNRTTKATEG